MDFLSEFKMKNNINSSLLTKDNITEQRSLRHLSSTNNNFEKRKRGRDIAGHISCFLSAIIRHVK